MIASCHIPVTEVQPGDRIRYSRTAANTDVYEVVGVSVYVNGGVIVRVKMTSVTGAPFEGKLSYHVGEQAEAIRAL